jgi:hypothetical protein
MRPLYAIAPLALVLALLAPSSQITPSVTAWSQEALDWVFDRNDSIGPTKTQPASPGMTTRDTPSAR